MRMPAADLLRNDLVNWPTDEGTERLVVVREVLRPIEARQGRGRQLRFLVEHDGTKGLLIVSDRASIDVRFESI